MSKITNDGLS